ncbi:MAG TPA: GntR family transcriptional regulator [Erysipelothrix sp.]|nr:GntR family transcriptional regulator [Erysipelothrix sp.]
MIFTINYKSPKPLYEQIVDQVQLFVSQGLLVEDQQLPSVRELAGNLGINPNTVSRAYQELERKNLILTIAGRGTFVAATDDIQQQLHQENLSLITETILQLRAHNLSIEQIEQLFLQQLEEIQDADYQQPI